MKETSLDCQCRVDIYETNDAILDNYQNSTHGEFCQECYEECFPSM